VLKAATDPYSDFKGSVAINNKDKSRQKERERTKYETF
jgi:hypothetical protein